MTTRRAPFQQLAHTLTSPTGPLHSAAKIRRPPSCQRHARTLVSLGDHQHGCQPLRRHEHLHGHKQQPFQHLCSASERKKRASTGTLSKTRVTSHSTTSENTTEATFGTNKARPTSGPKHAIGLGATGTAWATVGQRAPCATRPFFCVIHKFLTKTNGQKDENNFICKTFRRLTPSSVGSTD